MNLSKKIDYQESATESSLAALAMSGDDNAFEELVRRRQGTMRGLMRQLTGDWTIADDLSQEAFLMISKNHYTMMISQKK